MKFVDVCDVCLCLISLILIGRTLYYDVLKTFSHCL